MRFSVESWNSLWAIALVVGGLCVGCGSTTETPVDPEEPVAESPAFLTLLPHRAASNAGEFAVAYRTLPPTIPLNEPFTIEVAVFEDLEFREPARDVELHADAGMPQHRHGMNVQPFVTPIGPGRFRVEGMIFHMPGAWELYFDLARGAVTERAQFDVELE